MILDNEEQREVLLAALDQLPIQGPILHPELLQKVMTAHKVKDAIMSASVTSCDIIYDESGIAVGSTSPLKSRAAA